MSLRNHIAAAVALAATASLAFASMRITEYMYSGNSGEFVEFTNVGASPIDMTGWSFNDDDPTGLATSLSDFGIVAPGQSVVMTEIAGATFITNWSLSGVAVVGGNANNLARNDTINLFDNNNVLIDQLAFGDQTYPGTIRTQNVSGNPSSPAVLGTNAIANWVLSVNGDAFGSVLSAQNDIGNPGRYIPEPASFALVLVAGIAIRRR